MIRILREPGGGRILPEALNRRLNSAPEAIFSGARAGSVESE